MLADPQTDSIAKNEVTERIFDYVLTKSDIETASQWLDAPTPAGVNLSKAHKSGVLITICRSDAFGREYKDSMIQKILGDDQSDTATQTKLTCEAAMPDKEQKMKIWH
jgi:hypothetical protein